MSAALQQHSCFTVVLRSALQRKWDLNREVAESLTELPWIWGRRQRAGWSPRDWNGQGQPRSCGHSPVAGELKAGLNLWKLVRSLPWFRLTGFVAGRCYIYVFFFLFYWSIVYNVVLVSGVQQSDSVLYICVLSVQLFWEAQNNNCFKKLKVNFSLKYGQGRGAQEAYRSPTMIRD